MSITFVLRLIYSYIPILNNIVKGDNTERERESITVDYFRVLIKFGGFKRIGEIMFSYEWFWSVIKSVGIPDDSRR